MNEKHVFSVSELNQASRLLLESHLQTIWLEGEISNFSSPYSGHWYFSLKDEKAQVRCAMFHGQNAKVHFKPKDGMHILARAKVSLYEPRGDYQLIVSQMEEMGFGTLQKAFDELKEKLLKEGLFDASHKKPIPKIPTHLGLITSKTGAAIHDISSVLERRFPCLPLTLYPTLVQGDLAADQIVEAIEKANHENRCDVLILSRGGGSLEDLWPFNEERVARAIFASHIPIVTGIGHEVDFTISDFAADQRAPTPSAAAELVTPNKSDLMLYLKTLKTRLTQKMLDKIEEKKRSLMYLEKRLTQQHPLSKLQQLSQRLDQLHQRLTLAQKRIVETKRSYFQSLVRALNAVSPLSILARGYSITSDESGHTISSIKQVPIDKAIQVRLNDGRLNCEVKDIITEKIIRDYDDSKI